MHTNMAKVRRVILDNRLKRCYKPDRAVICYIGELLPDANIFGFGFIPELSLWGVLVESAHFPDNPFSVIRDISFTQLYTMSPHYIRPIRPVVFSD